MPVKIVDAMSLPQAYRNILRPGEEVEGMVLPRYFYELPDWETAVNTEITPNFDFYEFLVEDLHEDELFQKFPRYLPCAVSLLAAALEVVRAKIGKPIYIAANGGYRSPAHACNRRPSLHSLGTAANIYRIGDDFLDSKDAIENYAGQAKKALGGLWVRPFGHGIGQADDHLHVDIGYAIMKPSE